MNKRQRKKRLTKMADKFKKSKPSDGKEYQIIQTTGVSPQGYIEVSYGWQEAASEPSQK